MVDLIKKQAEALSELLESKKAEDVVILHVGDRTVVADYFVICSGRSEPHVRALCDDVEDHLNELELNLIRKDGYNESRWVVMDFGSILLHIFLPEERAYYNMERLWRNEE